MVERWQRDKQKREEKFAARRDRQDKNSEEYEQKKLAKQRRTVVGLIEAGQLSKAMGRVTSFGLGNIREQAVKNQLLEKFSSKAEKSS